MSPSVIFFLFFIALTLVITYWASKRSRGSAVYFAAGRRVMGWQNGLAIAGDFMSAASFLGVVGLISLFGIDGFVFATGGLVAFMAILLIVAEPLRNVGKYTMADVLAYRHRVRPVTIMAAASTLIISTFYMIAQMVGAGALMSLLLRDAGISYRSAVIAVGILMTVYVVFGGMLATTWVQIVKAILLMACTVVLTVLVMRNFHFDFSSLLAATSHVSFHVKGQLGRPAALLIFSGEESREMQSEHLVHLVAFDALGAGVPGKDVAVPVEQINGVLADALDDRAQTQIVDPQLLLARRAAQSRRG